MVNDVSCCIRFMTVIAGRKHKEALLDALFAHGGRLLNLVYGKGSVTSSYIKEMLGLVLEENKVIITCLIPGDKADDVFNMLAVKFHFDKPNTGIAFTIPVEKLSF